MEPGSTAGCGGCITRCRGRCADRLPARISRATAQWALPSAMAAVIAVCNLGGPLGTLIVSAVLVWAFIGVALNLALAPPPGPDAMVHQDVGAVEAPGGHHSEEEVAGSHRLLHDAAGVHAAAAAMPAQQPTSRETYLDAVKAALAVIVIVHHTAGAFAGGGSLGLSVGNYRSAAQPILLSFQLLNQSYFMSLFIFVSAYFVPASIARKGVRFFLRDRGARLGMPFLLIYLLLAPAWMLVVQAAQGTFFSGFSPSYVGPPWFVVWLGVFCFAYASVAEAGGPASHVVCALPSPGVLALVGLGLGGAQALQLIYFPAFPLMPITFGSLPSDVAAFVAGILARRNGWLVAPFPRALVWTARAYAVAFALALIGGLQALHAAGGGAYLLSRNACGQPADRDGGLEGVGVIALLSLASGPFTIFMSVAVLDLARTFANGPPSPVGKLLAENAYAAYLLHPTLVFPATLGAGVFAASRTGAPVVWAPSSSDSTSCLAQPGGSEAGVLLLGFLAVSAVSLVGTYALAALVRLIPSVAKVL